MYASVLTPMLRPPPRATSVALAAAIAAMTIACGPEGELASIGAGGSSATTSSVSSSSVSSTGTMPPASMNWDREIKITRIEIDLSVLRGSATLELAPSTDTGASFEIEGLAVLGARSGQRPLNVAFADGDRRLDVGVPADTNVVTIDYNLHPQPSLQGYVETGLTSVWPNYCGNLFPCQSSPSKATALTLLIENPMPGNLLVYPPSIFTPVPSYVLGWAAGDYHYQTLGETTAHTEVGVYALAGHEAAAQQGTKRLRDVFDWYERTLGHYAFGSQVASVEVDLPAQPYGPLAHQPYWHVATSAMSAQEAHAHEAAHGWIGAGVRIACWEDLTIAEGAASYLAARALSAVGEPDGDALWPVYRARLDAAMATPVQKIARPSGCDSIDVMGDLYSDIPAMKGALFLRALEGKVGSDALSSALTSFIAHHTLSSAGLADLLEEIHDDTGYDAAACAADWLQKAAVPVASVCP